MQLEKIQNDAPKVPALIMEALIKAIEDGTIKQGEELPPERTLAEQFGVGRGSLRECLAIMEFVGAVESRGYRKVLLRNADYIRKVSSWVSSASQISSQQTFNEFRRVIEVGNVELACRRATEEDIKSIKKAVDDLANEPGNYMNDVAFHDAVAVASHNSMLASTMHLVNNLIAEVRIRFWDLPNYQDITQRSHVAIYEAVRDRDVQRARLEMIKHLGIVEEFSKKYPGRSSGSEEATLPSDGSRKA